MMTRGLLPETIPEDFCRELMMKSVLPSPPLPLFRPRRRRVSQRDAAVEIIHQR